MKTNDCPAGCGATESAGLHPVSPSELKFTPLILTASRMQEDDQLLLCSKCGRVVRRSFDSYILRFHLQTLGTYSVRRDQFEPGPWLLSEMDRLTVLSPNGRQR